MKKKTKSVKYFNMLLGVVCSAFFLIKCGDPQEEKVYNVSAAMKQFFVSYYEAKNMKVTSPAVLIDTFKRKPTLKEFTIGEQKDAAEFLALLLEAVDEDPHVLAPRKGTLANNRFLGLRNLGNTCFMNSVLQSLLHTKGFAARYLQKESKSGGNTLQARSDEGIFDITTQSQVRSFLGNSVVYNRDGAEDPQKMLAVSLAEIGEPAYENEKVEVKLTECIDDYFKEEEITGFKPENAAGHFIINDKTKKKLSIKKLPGDTGEGYLLIQVKRNKFDYDTGLQEKMNNPIEYPSILELEETSSTGIKRFKLYALINHMGSFKSGHYTSVVKDFDADTWCELDDSRDVKEIDKDDVFSKYKESAYIFFYERLD